MKQSVIIGALIIGGAILLNGYYARAPKPAQVSRLPEYTIYYPSESGQESIQMRLIRLELEYHIGRLSSAKDSHRSNYLKSEIDALNKTPNIRDEKYWSILKEHKTQLETFLSELKSKGFLSEHPRVKSIQVQINATTDIQSQKS